MEVSVSAETRHCSAVERMAEWLLKKTAPREPTRFGKCQKRQHNFFQQLRISSTGCAGFGQIPVQFLYAEKTQSYLLVNSEVIERFETLSVATILQQKVAMKPKRRA